MKFKREKAIYFKDDFIVNAGGWNLTTASSFPKCEFLSADTETILLKNDGTKYANNEIYEFLHSQSKNKKFQSQKWLKENVNVKAYAFTLSNGVDFALFQNIEDFITACCMFRVKRVFWYNAKFDFTIFDYYFLTHNWTDAIALTDGTNKQLPSHTFANLMGDFGQRYQMDIWQEYKNASRHTKVHHFKMIDICNISAGGLAKNLKDWDIKDNDGTPLRKLEMEYQDADITNDNDLMYMRNDVVGLHKLTEAINNECEAQTHFSLFNGDYITAGGLSKKTFLQYMFNAGNKMNKKLFQKFIPMNAERDEYYRTYALYKGGIATINPAFVGVEQRNIHKFDSNSMYPHKMRTMLYPVGEAIHEKYTEDWQPQEGYVYVLRLKNFNGYLRDNMIPMYAYSLNGEYQAEFREFHDILIWLDELIELQNWYDLEFDIVDIEKYKGMQPKGIKKFVDEFYKIKSTTSGAKKQFAKVIVNSAYGKFSEKIERVKVKIALNDEGIVHTEEVGTEIDTSSMLSVLIGSRITALARVDLMKHIRVYTNNNPAKYFVYCDTDSCHILVNAEWDIDDKILGKYKNEGTFKFGIYLAPKSYMLANSKNEYEVHCKGVNTKSVKKEIDGKMWQEALKIFKGNRMFKTLCGLNVHGGKALIYVDKMIIREDIPILTKGDDFDIID